VDAIIEQLRSPGSCLIQQELYVDSTAKGAQRDITPVPIGIPDLISLNQDAQFNEGFGGGLENWVYEGEWSVIKEGEPILIVTNSGGGGIARPCMSWRNYICEFETRIMNGNTSWIIRAQNLATYVMLQCQPHGIYPHYRNNGQWKVQNMVPLPKELPTETWFRARIEVRESDVNVTLILHGEEIKIPILTDVLKTPSAPIEYSSGSFGFRESSVECAHFRGIIAKKI
jgi:hypothetical protein